MLTYTILGKIILIMLTMLGIRNFERGGRNCKNFYEDSNDKNAGGLNDNERKMRTVFDCNQNSNQNSKTAHPGYHLHNQ